jgi:hypothetical protein
LICKSPQHVLCRPSSPADALAELLIGEFAAASMLLRVVILKQMGEHRVLRFRFGSTIAERRA